MIIPVLMKWIIVFLFIQRAFGSSCLTFEKTGLN